MRAKRSHHDLSKGDNTAVSARKIVFTSGKGGVGKTTTTANVGAALAKRGHRVILVDADIGLRNLDLVLGLEKRIVFDLVEVIEGRCQIRQALIKDKRFDSLSILPAAQTRDKDAVTEAQMVSIMNDLAAMADYVLIDCPAGIEGGFRNAVAGASEAVVVTTPEVSAIRDADRVIGKLAERSLPVRLIVNRIRPDMVRSGDMLSVDDVCEILSAELLGIVPDDEEIIDTTNRGEPIVLNDANRLRVIYDKIARRLEDELVAFTNLDNNGFLGRLLGALKAG
jgi:septum site-determining protein MinD